MTTPAKELRELVRELEDTCRRSRVHSMAWPAVTALSEYLCLRARIMEIESRTHCPELSSEDPPTPRGNADVME